MTKDPSFWLVLTALLTPGGIGFLWLRKKLRLTPDAADAVSPGIGPKPADVNDALIVLAKQLDEHGKALDQLRIYVPLLQAWGHRGWRHAPVAQREPMPEPPQGLAL